VLDTGPEYQYDNFATRFLAGNTVDVQVKTLFCCVPLFCVHHTCVEQYKMVLTNRR
jgi:hypothetical protein